MVDKLDDARDEADVFRSAPTWNDESVVIFRLDLVKRGVENEIMAALFRVGLIAFKIVDGGANVLTGFFSGADRVNRMAYHTQRLEWDHHFVVFDVIAHDHQNGFLGHENLRTRKHIKWKRPGRSPASI